MKRPSPNALTVSQVRRAITILRETSDAHRAYSLCGGGASLRRALERLAGMKLPREPRAVKRGAFHESGVWRLVWKAGLHPVIANYRVYYYAARWTGTQIATNRRWPILSSGDADEALALARVRMAALGWVDEMAVFVKALEKGWKAAALDAVPPESPFWSTIVAQPSQNRVARDETVLYAKGKE